jgi:hypothetical protein
MRSKNTLPVFSDFVMTALAHQPVGSAVRTMQTINIDILNPLFFLLFFEIAGPDPAVEFREPASGAGLCDPPDRLPTPASSPGSWRQSPDRSSSHGSLFQGFRLGV